MIFLGGRRFALRPALGKIAFFARAVNPGRIGLQGAAGYGNKRSILTLPARSHR